MNILLRGLLDDLCQADMEVSEASIHFAACLGCILDVLVDFRHPPPKNVHVNLLPF